MFAAQQSQFSQQIAYSQQIGVGAVPPNQSLAAWGAPPRQQQQPSFPGVHAPPPAFSYAPSHGFMGSGLGYGGGNKFASGVMSGAAGLGTLGGLALGFSRMAPLVDPIAGGMAGFAAGGMGGAALGVAAPLALGYAASRMAGSVIEGGQQMMQTNTTLGQNFGFANQNSRTGFGFSRNDAQAIHSMVRGMGEMPELLSSFQELNGLIPKLRQSGVFQGVRDATEFNRRFKESIHTLRDMSKVLGSTMEEAANFFQQSRQAGFTSKSGQMYNALQVRYTAAATGMGTDQVMAMQMGGAGMAQQMGIRRGIGAQSVTNVAQQLQGGLEAGALDQGLLEDLTGATGSDAVGAGAQMITGTMAGLFKGTSFGRQSMLALAKFDKSGKYAGLDMDRVRRLQEGTFSWEDQKRAVSGLSRKQKMEVISHEDTLAMQAAGAAGPAGFARQVGLMRERGYDDSAIRLELKKLTGSENTADMLMQMEGQISESGDLMGFAERTAKNAALRERKDPRAVFQRIGTKIKAATEGKLEEVGSHLFSKISETYDDFWDEVFQNYSVTLSKEGARTLSQAFTGTGEKDLKKLFADAAGVSDQYKFGSPGGGGRISRNYGARMAEGALTGAGMGAAMGVGFFGIGAAPAAATGAIVGGLVGGGSMLAADVMDKAKDLFGEDMSETGQFLRQAERFGTVDAADQLGALTEKATLLASIKKASGIDTGLLRAQLDEGVHLEGMTEQQKYETRRKKLSYKLAAAAKSSMVEKGGYEAGDEISLGASLASGEKVSDTIARVGESGFLDMLKSTGMSDEAAQAAYEKIQKLGDVSTSDAVMQATGVGDVMKTTGAGAFFSMGVEERAEKLKGIKKKLGEGLGASELSFLENSKKTAGNLIRDMQDPDKASKLRSLISDAGEGDPRAFEKLKEMGYDVKEGDVESLRSITTKMADKDKGGDITKNLRDLAAHQAYSELKIHKGYVDDYAATIKDEGAGANLKQALTAYSKAIESGGKGGDEAIAGVRAAYADLTAQAQSLSPDKQEAFYESLGKAGSAIKSGVSKGEAAAKAAGQGRFKSKKDLEEYLTKNAGLSEAEARSVSSTYRAGEKLSKEQVAEISASAAETAGSGAMSGKAGQGQLAGEKDKALLDALNNVKKSIDGNSTILATAFADKLKDVTDESRKNTQKLISEVTDSKGSGG